MKPPAFSPRRYLALAVLGVLWAGGITARLVHLQVLQYGKLAQRAQNQQQRTIEVSPRRGILYDRNYRELAMSVQVDSVFVAKGEIPQPENTLSLLAGVLNLDPETLQGRLRSGRHFAWIKRKVSPEEAERVRALNLKGVYLQKESKRYYPKGELAAHVLGYVGLDENGLGGIEQQYEPQVRGRPGQLLVQADAKHRWFGRREARPPDAGGNVVLTIDEKIQFLVEKELAETVEKTRAKGATVVVLDVATGEVLAMANQPVFNPNQRSEVDPEVWKNRAIAVNYEPGSTMKIITIAAALEEKLARPDEIIDCQMGSINVFGQVIRDHHPFGALPVTGIMAHSSDVGAIKLGMRLGNERFYRYIRAFGLGTPTGVELPGEERGLTRPPERWTKSSVGAISMGQELGATALQMAAAANVIANGGQWIRPRVVREVFRQGSPQPPGWDSTVQAAPPSRTNHAASTAGGRAVISPETALEVKKMLEQVVLAGTGKSARLNGYTSAGKTGTAQKYDPKTGTYSRTDYVASFIGFAPVNNPTITIAVILDSPVGLHQGGQVAAPLFKRIAEKVLAHLEVPPDLPVAGAGRFETLSASLDPAQLSDFAAAETAESLAAVEPAPDPSITVIDLEGALQAPDFLGKSLRAVAEQALSQGLEVDLLGSGVAREQTPPPGGRLLPGRKITVRFAR